LADDSQYAPTGQAFQQFWFLRDGESGWHSFTRLYFDNGTAGIDLGNVQEFRQVFSPNTVMWTHLVTNDLQYGHLPSKSAIDNEVYVLEGFVVDSVANDTGLCKMRRGT
jgi:rhamnogalacturonan endolyase